MPAPTNKVAPATTTWPWWVISIVLLVLLSVYAYGTTVVGWWIPLAIATVIVLATIALDFNLYPRGGLELREAWLGLAGIVISGILVFPGGNFLAGVNVAWYTPVLAAFVVLGFLALVRTDSVEGA